MIFVDTNIWLYALTASGDDARKATATRLLERKDVVLSTQVINELLKNYRKYQTIPEPALRAVVGELYLGYRVLDVDKTTILAASELREEYNLSYWDSVIVASALSSNAKQLLSEDMQHGLVIRQKLTITNPFRTLLPGTHSSPSPS